MKTLEKIDKVLQGKWVATGLAAVALLCPFVNWCLRNGYVFIDHEVFGGFAYLLFALMIVNAALLVGLVLTGSRRPELKNRLTFKILYYTAMGLTVFFFLYNILQPVLFPDEALVYWSFFLDALPVGGAVYFALILLLVLPKLPQGKVRAAVSGGMMTVLLLAVFIPAFHLTPYAFASEPVVFDNGADYSIVFATSDIGSGYVEYTYEGEDYRVYDERGGKIRGSETIHTVRVPYEHLDGNSYTVHSRRTLDELGYGGNFGKTLSSEAYQFRAPAGETLNALVITDWHSEMKRLYDAAANFHDYQAVIMLGDSMQGLNFERDVIDYILAAGARLTKGAMPVIYCRGNHETRGKAAAELGEYLGLDSFYFTAKLGDYNVVVLDSGEDKPDDNWEYAGQTDYERERADMIGWLEDVNLSEGRTIVLSHDKNICIEEDLSARAYREFGRLNVSLLLSGHSHSCDFGVKEGIPVFTCGGRTSADGKKIFNASLLSLTAEGAAVRSADNFGTERMNESFLFSAPPTE